MVTSTKHFSDLSNVVQSSLFLTLIIRLEQNVQVILYWVIQLDLTFMQYYFIDADLILRYTEFLCHMLIAQRKLLLAAIVMSWSDLANVVHYSFFTLFIDITVNITLYEIRKGAHFIEFSVDFCSIISLLLF